MSEYSVPDIAVVRSGDPIRLADPEKHDNLICRVNCTWRNLRTNEMVSETDDINKNDLTEGYHEWKKRHWRKLFDPFSIKIESIDIQMIPR